MAVIYLSETFLPAPQTGENFLKIRDGEGSIRYKVYNNSISSTHIIDDMVIIKTEADSKVLKLKFKTQTEAANALVKLRTAIENIKKNYEIKKDSKFSDLSFSLYNDSAPENTLQFDLSNVTGNKVLSIGAGNTLITETELNSKFNTLTQFRFFDHFLTLTNLEYGTYSNCVFFYPFETNRNGIFQMLLDPNLGDAFIWSGVNSLKIKDGIEFSSSLKISNFNSCKIVIGFINNVNINQIANGTFFMYDSNLNSNWITSTKNVYSNTTLENTLIPADNNWHTYTIRFRNDLLEFLIDDNVVSTRDNSFLPSETGAEFGFGVLAENSSTENLSALIDWIKVDANLPF